MGDCFAIYRMGLLQGTVSTMVRDCSVNMVSSEDKHQCDKPVVVLLLNDEQHLVYICYIYVGDAYTLYLPCFVFGYCKISSFILCNDVKLFI